ncbi:MAG: LysR substrate-binding domain-containing protein [Pseudomonadales bacterium]
MKNKLSMSGLKVFSCAAQRLSFTAAAEELGLSQPAVSHAVKQLEKHLGTPLFSRHHRGLQLTPAGEKFYADITIGLSHIEQSVQSLQLMAADDERVTLSISTAFATHWLLPRVAGFKVKYPHIDLRFQTTAYDIDLNQAGIGLGVRYGSGSWPSYHSWRLFDEEVLAVCSPDYLVGNAIVDPASLQQHALIHLDEPHRTRMDWHRWFAHLGIEAQAMNLALNLNDYAIVLQAAIEGQGIALGWHYIVERLVANGQLVPACQQTVCTEKGFYLVSPANIPLTPYTKTVRDWMLAEAGHSPASKSSSSAPPSTNSPALK